VAKWKKHSWVQDATMGPNKPSLTILNREEEALIVAFRKHTLLPLNDYLYALQAMLPYLTRLALHHCLQRHGVSRVPDMEGDKTAEETVQALSDRIFPYGDCRSAEEGRLYLFVPIDRTCKFTYAELHPEATRQ